MLVDMKIDEEANSSVIKDEQKADNGINFTR